MLLCKRNGHFEILCPDLIISVCEGMRHAGYMYGTAQNAACSPATLPWLSDVDSDVEVEAFMTADFRGTFDLRYSGEMATTNGGQHVGLFLRCIQTLRLFC